MTERGTRARYADVVVACAPIRPGASALTGPLLVVEVLSETTAAADRGAKRAEHAALPSIARYVMLAQDEGAGPGVRPRGRLKERAVREVLELPELGMSVPLPRYEGLV